MKLWYKKWWVITIFVLMIISVLSNIASGPVEKKVVQTPREEKTAPIAKETEYEYIF